MKYLVKVFFILFPLISYASTLVDKDLKIYDLKIKEMNSSFDQIPSEPKNKEWVKKKLDHMVKVDQFMRNFMDIKYEKNYSEDEVKYFETKFEHRWENIDLKHTEDLKQLIKIYNWFNISAFGKKADNDAWLIVQHADHDIVFQRKILKVLQKLLLKKETNPSNYAYLFDRVAASWHDPSKRTLQRYGTQGMCESKGIWKPIPIEDPKNVDVRRSKVGLGSLKEYISGFKKICK